MTSATPSDVESIDAIITALYDGISGPSDKKRDWDRERSLYLPGARLIPLALRPGSNEVDPVPNILDVDGFIARAEPFFEKNGFYEVEVARETQRFGQMAHAWSTYESRRDPGDPEPFMRGINSIQLFHDGARWWILNIYWQQESAKHPLPEKISPLNRSAGVKGDRFCLSCPGLRV
jgi:hypothetical protein